MRTSKYIALVLLCGAALPAHAADSWTPGGVLSGPKDVYNGSSAAIDPRGDAVAVWVDQASINGSGLPDRLLARTRMAGATLGPSSTVAVTDVASNIYDPRVFMSDTGLATAFWYDGNHVRYNDRPLGGHWTATQNVTPNSPVSNGFTSAYAIAADHIGDLAVRVNDEVFVRRNGGGQFRSVGFPLDSTRYPNIQPDGDLLISPSGDVVAFQTTYDVVCNPPGSRHCRKINLKLRLSRLRPGSTTWQVAGDNDLTTGDAYVLDDQGRLAFATQTGPGIVVRTQPSFGASVITVTTLPTTGAVGGFGVDAAGTATVLASETAARQTIDFVGPLGGGSNWVRQLVLANADPAYRPTDFKVSSSGSAAFVWQASATADSPVFANTRATNTASWSAPVKLSGPIPHYNIDWLAVAANNQAITTWTRVGQVVSGNFSIHNPQ